MKIKIFVMCAGLAVLSACASKPPPVEVVQPQEPAQIVAPIQVVPQKKEAIVTEPTPQPVEQPYIGPVPGSLADFKYVSGEDRVYFSYDQYDLSQAARDTLRKQAEWLNEYGNAIVVIGGNADERGTREYNLVLGARRAETAKAFLVSQGVAPKRITTVSYGKERPIDSGSTESAWARNRNAHSGVIIGGRS